MSEPIPVVTVRTLGPPSVAVGETALRFPSRKALALVLYVALRNTPCSRSSLATLLWPDSAPERAMTSLRSTLARVRRTFEDVEVDPLAADRQSVWLREGVSVRVDAGELADVAAGSDLPVEDLERVLDTVDGVFFEGFTLADAEPFEEWVGATRVLVDDHVDAVAGRLVASLVGAGRPVDAVRATDRWISSRPLSELAHLARLEALVLAGEPGRARRHWNGFVERSVEALGVEPSSGSQARARELFDRRGPVAAPPASRAQLPLLGRSDEMRRLREASALAEAGLPQVILVEGTAGVGKSRLLDEFVSWRSVQPGRVQLLRGAAYEMGSAPLRPLADAVRAALERERDLTDLLDDTWLLELARLVPVLRARRPDLAAEPADDPHSSHRLHEAIVVLGMALADRGLTVLTLDDAQWADTETLDTLAYATRRWTELQVGIIVIVGARQSSGWAAVEARRLFRALDDRGALTHIELGPLGRDSIGSWLGEGGDPLAELLHRRTGGLPVFLDTMLGELESLGRIVRDADGRIDPSASLDCIDEVGDLPIPSSVTALVDDAIDGLDDVTTAVAAAAAVIGQPVEVDTIAAVAGVDARQAVDALDMLLDRRLATSSEDAAVALAHDLVRSAIYARLSAPRRRLYHRTAADLLHAEPAATRAHHALRGGLDDAAFDLCIQAGRDAAALAAAPAAADHYQQAAGLIDRVDASSEAILEVASEGGRQLELANRFPEALDLYHQLETVAADGGDDELRLACLVGRARVLALPAASGDLERAASVVEEGLSVARRLGNRGAESTLLWVSMNVRRRQGRPDQALVAGRQSLSMAEDLGFTRQIAFTALDLGNLQGARNDWDDGLSLARRSAAAWDRLGDPAMRSDALNNAAIILIQRGEIEEASDLASEAATLARELGNDWGVASTAYTLALVALQREDVATVRALAETGRRAGQRADLVAALVAMDAIEALALRTRGDAAAATSLAARSLARAEQDVAFLRPLATGVAVLAALDEGRVGDAAALVESLEADPDSPDRTQLVVPELAMATWMASTADAQAVDYIERCLASAASVDAAWFVPELTSLAAQVVAPGGGAVTTPS